MTHLIICREYPPAPSGGGIGTYVHHMAELLAAHGETVHVIGQLWPGAPRSRETRAGGRLVVHRVAAEDPWRPEAARAFKDIAVLDPLSDPGVPGGYSWQAAMLAESLIDTAGVDIIEAQEYEAPLYALMLRRFAGLGPSRQVPLLVHLHTPSEFVFTANEWESDLRAHATLIQLEDMVIRAADARVCPSRFLARIAETRYELERDSIEVIPYPMGDTDPIARDEATWRAGTICYAGRLEPRKGVFEWIAAATVVARDVPARFTLVGRDTAPECSPGDSTRARLLAAIPHALGPRFRFVEAVPRRQVLAHLAEARIAVVPSRWENFPFACIEAMATGLPVLASPVGGMAEMVEDGKTGWIAAGVDPHSLQITLRRALATPPAVLSEMGAAAARSIRERCDNQGVLRRQLDFRQRVVERGCRPSRAFTPVAGLGSNRPALEPRAAAQGQTMTALDILRATPRQQLAVLRRAVANPRYVGDWLAWHIRRSTGRAANRLRRWTRSGGAMVACLLAAYGGMTATAQAEQAEESRPPAEQNRAGPAVVTVPYASSDDEFANPERGFYRQLTPFWIGDERFPMNAQSLLSVRGEGISLVRAYFVIDEFRDAPLSREALQRIAADFDAVRRAGLKIIPRFAYNFPTMDTYREAVDAPLERVLRHINQLRPILRANADVIAFMETGFVGAWGEWHSSSSGLLDADRGINQRSSAIVKRLLRALPNRRMLALRYPFHKEQLFGPRPLPPGRAFKGSPQARIGAHNDCFASGEINGGTYSPPLSVAQTIASLKQYLSDDNRFVVQGGESCGTDVVSSVRSDPYAHCPSALADLAMMRWSTINLAYHPEVVDVWRQEGCLDEVRRRLGYRFRLVDAAISTSVTHRGRFVVRLNIANDGWAAPYNPRQVEIVLRHASTGRLFRFPVKVDPRRWTPGATHAVTLERSLPRSLSAGEYDVMLNLPDPEKRLFGRPEYSIRLANAGTWEPLTGFNKLKTVVTVVPHRRHWF